MFLNIILLCRVQHSLSKYKTVAAKKKQKLESSLVRRSRKTEELVKIKAELEKLEVSFKANFYETYIGFNDVGAM